MKFMLKNVAFVLVLFFGSNVIILSQEELSVEKIWKNYEFYPASVNGFRSMNDGVHYTEIDDVNGSAIVKKSILDATSEVLVNSNALLFEGKSIQVDDYEFNSDESLLLLTTNTKAIYRRSFTADYYTYNLKTKSLELLDAEHSPQMLAEYSPNGKMVSYLYKNDIFVKHLETGKIVKLTQDGKRNKVINGSTDWVYEEEFSIAKAYDWSPDSKYIAFLKFDEKAVPEFDMALYENELYPETYTFKYPKAGEVNSIVTAHLITVSNGKIKPIDLGTYEYIPRLKWSDYDNKLIIQTLNRDQNDLKYYLVDATTKKTVSKVFFEEKSETYVEIDDNLLLLEDGKSILRTSESNGYNHIYRLTFDGIQTPVTSGNWDVIECLGIDESTQMIYFTSAEKSAITKGIYKIDINGQNKQAISLESGYNDAEFTTGMKYFIKTYSTANTPPIYSLCDNQGKELRVLEDNSKLLERLSNYELSQKEFVEFNSDGTTLNGWMIKPNDFDPSKKYPVYMTVYGGPGHNEVSDQWDGMDYMYHQLLAQKGYIVVSVDPRGTMYRGEDFKKSTYLNLGKLETEDIINTAKELQTYSYVDASRIGIQGWSFGGFMASLAITKGADVFKTAIAVAPVTNWKYYDNIYTERFMRTPAKNEEGYEQNSPINFVSKLKGNYFLIHGSADDNVHYQNTMEMVNALVKANKQFDLFIYPDRNHGIYGGNTRNHLFNMMLNYTLEHL
jgi:dipeptidyl-peptidase-4